MAPCGCFFDPRIYRIEWATTSFVQPALYKLTGGSNSQNAYLLDTQSYLKSPVQTVPYPPYHPNPGTPQYVMSYFNPEGSANVTDPSNLVSNLHHDTQFIEMLPPQEKGLLQSNDNKVPQLLITVPGLSQNELPLQKSIHYQLQGRPSPHNPASQGSDGFPVEGGELGEIHMSRDLLVNSQLPATCTEGQNPLSSPSVTNTTVMAEAESSLLQDSVISEKSNVLVTDESFDLPEKVLLEDAMKLFDCSPANSDSEASSDNLTGTLKSSESKSRDCCSPREDSSSDIQSLNLPEELLSFDYGVPEILNTVTSLDYFCDLSAFSEEPKWDVGQVLQPSQTSTLLQGPRQEPQGKTQRGSTLVRKGKHTASKNKPASAQDSGTADGQECPVAGV